MWQNGFRRRKNNCTRRDPDLATGFKDICSVFGDSHFDRKTFVMASEIPQNGFVSAEVGDNFVSCAIGTLKNSPYLASVDD